MTAPVKATPAAKVRAKPRRRLRSSRFAATQKYPTATPSSAHAPHGKSENHAIGRWPPRYELSGRGIQAGKTAGPMTVPRPRKTAATASEGASWRRPPRGVETRPTISIDAPMAFRMSTRKSVSQPP